METYQEMKKRHQDEINALPLAFAFSDEQLRAKLDAWNITEEEAVAGAIINIGHGGFIRSSDEALVMGTFERITREEDAARAADLTGDGYIYEMFLTELNNHEYSYTGDIMETLDALHITPEELNASPALQNGLKKAVKEIASGPDPFDE